jgi:hypothetical protein
MYDIAKLTEDQLKELLAYPQQRILHHARNSFALYDSHARQMENYFIRHIEPRIFLIPKIIESGYIMRGRDKYVIINIRPNKLTNLESVKYLRCSFRKPKNLSFGFVLLIGPKADSVDVSIDSLYNPDSSTS